MLQKLDITGIHVNVRDDQRTYITNKLGTLDKYIPRHSYDSAHLEVRLTEAKVEGRKQPFCEVTLHLPRETIAVKEHGATVYAAVDLVEAKLKQQIKRYKDQLPSGERSQHIFARLRRKLSPKLSDVS